MATRRPLVRNGASAEELPVGDSVAGVPAGIFAYKQDNTVLRIWTHLSGVGFISVLLSDGVSTRNVGVNYNG